MKKKEKKRNGIPARTRKGILAACMVFFFSLQIFQGKMLWRESTGESPGKVLSGKVPAEEDERTQIMETTQQKEPVSDAQAVTGVPKKRHHYMPVTGMSRAGKVLRVASN